MPLSFVHSVHRATHRIGLYLDKLGEPGLTQGEAHILAMLAHSGPAKVAELHRGLASGKPIIGHRVNGVNCQCTFFRVARTSARCFGSGFRWSAWAVS